MKIKLILPAVEKLNIDNISNAVNDVNTVKFYFLSY